MKRTNLLLTILGVFLISAPFLFQARYSQHVLILVLLYVALGSAWNILGGFAGQLSLGHAAFFGIGAYTAAVLASKTQLSPWWAIPVGLRGRGRSSVWCGAGRSRQALPGALWRPGLEH